MSNIRARIITGGQIKVTLGSKNVLKTIPNLRGNSITNIPNVGVNNMQDIRTKLIRDNGIKAILGPQNVVKTVPILGRISLNSIAGIDTTDMEDKYVMVYDKENGMVKFVNPDEVLSSAATSELNQPGLPEDFINTLDDDLDHKIDLDAGEF
jgi:hypothetical protein